MKIHLREITAGEGLVYDGLLRAGDDASAAAFLVATMVTDESGDQKWKPSEVLQMPDGVPQVYQAECEKKLLTDRQEAVKNLLAHDSGQPTKSPVSLTLPTSPNGSKELATTN